MNEKTTILIIEDQRGFRIIYEDVLANAGYEVISAADGERGWETARERKPNLILLDLGLPKMDGFEVLQRIRADAGTQNIPVIIFSVMGEQNSVKKAMELGANDYTIKGFYTPLQILSKIKGQLTQTEPMRTAAPFQVPMGTGGDEAKFQKQVGLTQGYGCPQCGKEMVLELFPDHVLNGSHWFSSRLACPHCGKGV